MTPAACIPANKLNEPWVLECDKKPRAQGRVDFYFKPANKWPARIYTFYQAELWQPRNLQAIGFAGLTPFLKRKMNRDEIEYCHFSWRLMSVQQDTWFRVMEYQTQEAKVLDLEYPGYGTKFLDDLSSFEKKYAHLLIGKPGVKGMKERQIKLDL